MRKFAALLLLCLLTACNLPRGGMTLSTEPGADPEPATDIPYTACGWVWATQSLPDLSAEVQSALEAAGLTGVTATAEAFGENCLNNAGEVDHFATMETDFRVRAEVPDLTDTAALGNLLERVLIVLDAFSPGATPGPQPGYIGVTFFHETEELNLWFTVTDGESARALGLHGAELFTELQNR